RFRTDSCPVREVRARRPVSLIQSFVAVVGRNTLSFALLAVT
ncbi:MAG: hypothetical protein ACI88G_001627, partial [Woeseiaceae bacterium]